MQCCIYFHLLSAFSSEFQSFMTIFHHKSLTREARVLANHLLIRSVIRKSYHMTLNIIFSVIMKKPAIESIKGYKARIAIGMKRYEYDICLATWNYENLRRKDVCCR